ncbi:MAG: methyltransferase domain-containing protein [Candidatus Poribacteria bacterium]|nr:methyltransferase domain-containing protein [Candidatus Poribacteria bacterium]
MFSKFKQRSYEPELLDDLSIVGEELDQTLAELRLVNSYLGGLSTTLAALAPELRKSPERSYRILDLGTGSADIPAGIVRWARKHHLQVEVIATDINPYTCAYARRCVADFPEIQVVAADVFNLPFADGSFDYTHAAMFTHHFTQEECVEIVKIMYAKATRGVLINDLHRHPVAYYSIKLLTRLLSKSRLVRHDGPLSVRRSFRSADIEGLACQSEIKLQYRWRWAFRWLITADAKREGVG